jgi:hypothetical protein
MTCPFRDTLREHQEATDCSDDDMVRILANFIAERCLEDEATDYVVEQLERGPGIIAEGYPFEDDQS